MPSMQGFSTNKKEDLMKVIKLSNISFPVKGDFKYTKGDIEITSNELK